MTSETSTPGGGQAADGPASSDATNTSKAHPRQRSLPPVLSKAPPAAMVIFGASGDLTARKILPALARLADRGVLDDGFTVAVIPYTAEVTTLGTKGVGALVNLEVDMVAKYVERLLAARG